MSKGAAIVSGGAGGIEFAIAKRLVSDGFQAYGVAPARDTELAVIEAAR